MELEALLESLLELAHENGLEVRIAGEGAGAPQTSGVCRVRGSIWVVLSTSDPTQHQIDSLAEGLRAHCGPSLDARFLAPAIRSRIFPEPL